MAVFLVAESSSDELSCRALHRPLGGLGAEGTGRATARATAHFAVTASGTLGAAPSAVGSVGVDSCQCQYGFTAGSPAPLLADTQCLACATGTYKSQKGNDECESCPAGQRPRVAAEYLTVMVFGGVYIDPLGVTQDGSCMQCEANTYSPSGSECVACRDHSSAPAGSISPLSCTFNEGYYENGQGLCEEYAHGFFKAGNGNQACEMCPTNTYTVQLGSAACTACPSDSSADVPAVSKETCHCNAGFFGPY